MSRQMSRILLVEDNEAHIHLIRRAFEPQASLMTLTVAHTLQEARDHMAASHPDLIVTDLRLPDGQGIPLKSAI